MACWPAYTVGAFFLALILFDMGSNQWSDLPMHGLVGVGFTLLFWLLCSVIGPSVTGGILVVPAVVLVIFMASVYITGQSLQNRGYCASHGCSQIILEKKVPPTTTQNPNCPLPALKATPLPKTC
jgi:hypothetical protein